MPLELDLTRVFGVLAAWKGVERGRMGVTTTLFSRIGSRAVAKFAETAPALLAAVLAGRLLERRLTRRDSDMLKSVTNGNPRYISLELDTNTLCHDSHYIHIPILILKPYGEGFYEFPVQTLHTDTNTESPTRTAGRTFHCGTGFTFQSS